MVNIIENLCEKAGEASTNGTDLGVIIIILCYNDLHLKLPKGGYVSPILRESKVFEYSQDGYLILCLEVGVPKNDGIFCPNACRKV